MFLDELLQRDGHGLLDDHWVFDVTGNTEKLGSSVVFVSERSKPRSATAKNSWRDSNCLNVGNSGWASENTHASWKRWLETWLTLSTLQGFNESGLLSANVGTGTTVEVDIEVISRSRRVLSDQAGSVRFVDGLIEHNSLVKVLSTDVNIGSTSSHGITSQQTTLYQLVWVLSHNFTVLTCSRLGFIGVDDQKGGSSVGFLGHEGPLETGWESSTSASTETGVLDLLDDPIGTHPHDFLRHVVITALQGVGQTPILFAIQVGENTVLILETTVSATTSKNLCTRGQCPAGLFRNSSGTVISNSGN
mmetsp:Transcript_32190/g.45769  ORF Transcript_32190/g.45769 Transcript_32190/m.45769 type:complete len:305 (-) Transcript_32190:35-949(-)